MIKLQTLILLSFGSMTSKELNRFLQIRLSNLQSYLCAWARQGYVSHTGKYRPFELTGRGRDTLLKLGSTFEVWCAYDHRVNGRDSKC